MSYVGQTLPVDRFSGYLTETFTGDGSTTAFTLTREPHSESSIIVVINNVVQQPVEDYTISGTTLTIDAAVASGDVKEIKEQVKGFRYSVLYMKAIKALQEAQTRIETLETKVAALEG